MCSAEYAQEFILHKYKKKAENTPVLDIKIIGISLHRPEAGFRRKSFSWATGVRLLQFNKWSKIG